MTTAKSSGSVGNTDKHGPAESHKPYDPDTRKVIATIATPRGITGR